MTKYRKKPVVIEAMQLIPGDQNNLELVRQWCGGNVKWGDRRISIRTLEGTMYAEPGDFVICGVKGEFYPCKPDIFEATYEKAESSV